MSACGSSRRRRAWASVAALLIAAADVGAGSPGRVLRVEGRRPQTAVVTATGVLDPDASLDTAMGCAVAGVLDVYDERLIGRLLRCGTGRAIPDDALADARRLCIVHLQRREIETDQPVEILQLPDRAIGARNGENTMLLHADKFRELTATWPTYRGVYDGMPGDAIGESFTMSRPYEPGAIELDPDTQKQRLYRSMPVRMLAPDRRLDGETLHARLPAGYDPKQPAGLLVWSSPGPKGDVPRVLGPALDELNMVCVVAANAGNDRDVPDKFQLVFDSIATASARYHIDPRRVYIAGMSGGGKVSSIMAICFPDVFAGAVPIVGFASYAELDSSWGKHHYGYYARPRGRMLEQALRVRMALMGGPPDFNYKEMVERQQGMESDGYRNMRLFSYPDMAHVMPTPPRFAEALRWVDEPWRQVRDAERQAAAALLGAYLANRDEPAPATDADRAALRDVVEAGPWTEPAWQALALLR
jgi:hypothetical protein